MQYESSDNDNIKNPTSPAVRTFVSMFNYADAVQWQRESFLEKGNLTESQIMSHHAQIKRCTGLKQTCTKKMWGMEHLPYEKKSTLRKIIESLYFQETEAGKEACILVHSAIDLIGISNVDFNLNSLTNVVMSAPSSRELFKDKDGWHIEDGKRCAKSYCFQLLRTANKISKREEKHPRGYHKWEYDRAETYFLDKFLPLDEKSRDAIIEVFTRAVTKYSVA